MMKYFKCSVAAAAMFFTVSNSYAALIEISVEASVVGPLPFLLPGAPPANFPPPFLTGDAFSARWVIDDSAPFIGTSPLPPPQAGAFHNYGGAVVEFEATISSAALGMDIDVSTPPNFSRGAQVINNGFRDGLTFDQFIIGANSPVEEAAYLNPYLANFPGNDDLFIATVQLGFGTNTATPDFLTSSDMPDILALDQLFSFSSILFDVRNGSATTEQEFFALPSVLYSTFGLNGTIRHIAAPPVTVSEPENVAIAGLGLLAISIFRRRRTCNIVVSH